MKGFVLAAGFGSRMRPITESVPKPLLPVAGVPLVVYSLRLLAHNGITDIVINTHHLSDELMKALGDGSRFGVNLSFSVEDEILGTGGGLKNVQEFLDDTFVVINSDILFAGDLSEIIKFHNDHSALATMVLRSDPKQADFGQIEVDDLGYIHRMLGQDGPGLADNSDGNGKHQPKKLHPYMFTGIHVMEPRFLEYIPPSVETCVVRYGYAKALANNEKLAGYVSEDYWADFGTPERFLAGSRKALNGGLGLVHMDPMSSYMTSPERPGVYMQDNVTLGEDVKLNPPVAIGAGTRIGEGSILGPDVVVGEGCKIGAQSVLSNAVIMDKSTLASGAEAVDVVVCGGDWAYENPPESPDPAEQDSTGQVAKQSE